MQFGEREGCGLGQVMVGGQGGKPGELARGLVERVGQPEGAGAVIADVIVDGRALQRRPRQQLQGRAGLRRVFEQGDGTRQVGQGTGGRAGGAAVDVWGEPEAGGLARQVGMACRGQPLVRGGHGCPVDDGAAGPAGEAEDAERCAEQQRGGGNASGHGDPAIMGSRIRASQCRGATLVPVFARATAVGATWLRRGIGIVERVPRIPSPPR